jgi:hypothetical protein
MGTRRIKITKDGVEATCNPPSLPVWERNGWTRADDGSSGETESTPDTQTPKEG